MKLRNQKRYVLTASFIGCFFVTFLFISLMESRGLLYSESHFTSPIVVSTGVIQYGDTLARRLALHNLPPQTVTQVQNQLAKVFDLRRMKPGHKYEVVTSTDGFFQSFTFHPDPTISYQVCCSSMGAYSITEDFRKTVWMEKHIVLEVQENIYKDLLKQGYGESFVANLVSDLADNIFAWRIDFFTEQRPGDQLEVLMEQEFIVGTDEPIRNGRGRILVASYKGKATRQKDNLAYLYQPVAASHADYYDEEGKAVKRVFLRAPFTHGGFRVSSGYSSNRFHPILRVYRAHHGVDYAASYGTPVAAIGMGHVVYAGWKTGYGKTVEVRHNSKYVSRYGHLSSIGVNPGQHIHQGQYLGRVGSTGLSTGPHLHFELLVDGQKSNFLRMTFPSATAVPETELVHYLRNKESLLTRLRTHSESIQLTRALEER